MSNHKNRNRDPYSFANINLLGRCNVDCFFCLGKDIEDLLSEHNQLQTHFLEWRNFDKFLHKCKQAGIEKLYITGQNTDSLVYKYVSDLIDFLHSNGFQVGLRTNGYLAHIKLDVINKCELSVGYSIHSLDSDKNYSIMKRRDIPDWHSVIKNTNTPRISIVVNRYNEDEVLDLIKFGAAFDNVRYIQIRRVSTDTRYELLKPDINAYDRVFQRARDIFPFSHNFVCAEVYRAYNKDVVFWPTVSTSVNSMNYFTDGTISDVYFVVEGYLNNR